LPFSISFEPTTSCNLRCPECPSGLRAFTRPIGMLEKDFFTKTIDEIHKDLLYLIFYFQGEPYLNPDFNLTMMSSDINIPVHHLSYYFNEYLNISFNTWKNNFKIDHVITLINNGTGEILTLDALAKQAGFGSRTSFFNSFKQKIGVTPSEYLNSLD
jgi:AraC-like DNA-binding protein